MKTKILIVEDDPSILTGLVDLLTAEGYDVVSTTDGRRGLSLYKANSPALVLLDIMVPELSGYDVCREIRKTDNQTIILMLTAKSEEIDKVVGLEIGADDYIVKPFGIKELLARIKAALRRKQAKSSKTRRQDILQFGDITINPKTMQGQRGQKTFEVTQRELDLLYLFCEHEGEVIDRDRILEEIWGITYEGTTRTLDQHIVKLRQKIEKNPAQPKHIQTVHGMGYRFSTK